MKSQWYKSSPKNAVRPFLTMYSGFALDAFNIQIYAFALPLLLTAWGLSHTQAGTLASAALVSSAFGGWIAGILADRFGRIRVLKLSILWFAIATCFCGLTTNFEQLLIARIIQGIGFGAEVAIGAVFVGEIASAKYRARMVGLAQSGWPIGWAIAATTCLLVFTHLPMEFAWRLLFFIGLAPAVLIFIFRSKLIELDVFQPALIRISWNAIFLGSIRSSTIKGSLLAAGVHTGYWAIAIWWPTILLAERGLTLMQSGPHLAALISGSLLGYAIGAYLGDKLGRRFTLACFALSGIALALLYSRLPLSNMPFILLTFPLGFVATGMYGIIGSFLAELYPNEFRGSGLGFCYNFGRGVAGLAPAIIGIFAVSFGVSNAVAVCVFSAYVLVLIVTLLLPETRGVTLKNIDEMTTQANS